MSSRLSSILGLTTTADASGARGVREGPATFFRNEEGRDVRLSSVERMWLVTSSDRFALRLEADEEEEKDGAARARDPE